MAKTTAKTPLENANVNKPWTPNWLDSNLGKWQSRYQFV